MGSAALHPSLSSPRHASDGDAGRDLVVLLSLDVPAQCWTSLPAAAGEPEPGEGCGDGDGAQAIRGVGGTTGTSALQHHCAPGLYRVPLHVSPCQLGPCPGCMSPHCPWVSITPCIVPLDWQGSPSWLRVPLPPGSPPWLPVPILSAVSILAACPCTTLSSLYWLRGPTLAVDACTSSVPMQAVRPCTGWVPVPAASPGGHRSHLAAPGERDHPCKQQVLSLCEPGLTATHKLLGRERGR